MTILRYSANPRSIKRNPLPITDAPKTDGPLPVTGVLGVGVATVHVQVVLSVQEGLRHDPEIQTSPEEQSVLTVHPLLHEERTGVGVGVALAHEQLLLSVQLGFRQELLTQTSPLLQSLLTVQVLLHPTVDVGVGVGVLLGVLVGVFVGVPDTTFVGVGVAITNESVHAGSAALGVTCGTLGATGDVRVSC